LFEEGECETRSVSAAGGAGPKENLGLAGLVRIVGTVGMVELVGIMD
jgi:hypothetical protein